MANANIDNAAETYALAVASFKAAELDKAEASLALLKAMQTAELERAETPSGKVSVSQGRRTVKITCRALAKEIEATRERAVRTGRAVENVGSPYVTLR
jgi:hypothetical protein